MGDLKKPLVEGEKHVPKVKTVDVVIVGAGLAGLTAAYYIHKADRGVTMVVLEAKGDTFFSLHILQICFCFLFCFVLFCFLICSIIL